MAALTICDSHGRDDSQPTAACSGSPQIAITGSTCPTGRSSSTAALSSSAIVEASTKDTVLASRRASKNSRAELTTTVSDDSRSPSARDARSDIQTIDLTTENYRS